MTLRTLLLAACWLALAPQTASAQDVLAKHKVGALKGLERVALVFRLNTPKEVIGLKTLTDIVELDLHNKVPTLIIGTTEGSSDWLETSLITAEGGGTVELCLYRWVRVESSGERIVAKVWWDERALFGVVSRAPADVGREEAADEVGGCAHRRQVHHWRDVSVAARECANAPNPAETRSLLDDVRKVAQGTA